MTGLEKIIHEIRDEAAREAKAIIETAEQQAQEIMQQSAGEQTALAEKILAQAKEETSEIERARESAIALQRRQHILQTKQNLLGETLQMAHQKLVSLPDNEYFALLLQLAKTNALPGKGQMLLNEKDLARLPEDFGKNLLAELPAGKELLVSEKTRPIDGGFVLKYGDVEENCTFKAMFDARREEFSDAITGTLFI